MAESKQRKAKYRRILLKLSGEAFHARDRHLSIDPTTVDTIARQIENISRMGVQIALVVGGGNIFRGVSGQARGIDRSSGDYMGMLATCINALALQNALERRGLATRVQTAISMRQVAEPFILRRALRHLEKGRVVIFGGGTGNPYFSTDSAAALRASEIGADVLLKGTKVDGVYSADPHVDSEATRFARLTYAEALAQSLKVMDGAAFSLCMENKIPIIVFDFFTEGNTVAAVAGEPVGTLVTSE